MPLLDIRRRFANRTVKAHDSEFSAYLSIYNDWDILLPALKSVAAHVDELVVVDGAYQWMEPYLKAIGGDPAKSDPPASTPPSKTPACLSGHRENLEK